MGWSTLISFGLSVQGFLLLKLMRLTGPFYRVLFLGAAS